MPDVIMEPVETKIYRPIKPFPSAKLCEIYSEGFEYAFVSPDDEQCHPWVRCKDFLTDAIWSQIHNKPVNIFSFKFDKINPRVSLNPVKLIVRNPKRKGDEFDLDIAQSVKFLNMIEDRIKLAHSTIEKVSHGKNTAWMFTCEPRWIHAPSLLSYLTLLIRVGTHYKDDGFQEAFRAFKNVKHNDASYLQSCRGMRRLILKRGLDIFKPKFEDNWPSNVDVQTVHGSWGIVGATRTFAKEILKEFPKEEEDKKKAEKKAKNQPVSFDI